jgi:hypothetical protein
VRPGRAGRGVRAGEVGEDGAHDGRVLDGGDDAQATATARTGQDVEGEHAAHQRRPSPAGCGASAGRDRVGLLHLWVWRRGALILDHLWAPVGMRGEDAMVEHQVNGRPGDDGGELLQQLDRVEEQM